MASVVTFLCIVGGVFFIVECFHSSCNSIYFEFSAVSFFVSACSRFTRRLFLLLLSCPNVHVHEFATISGLFRGVWENFELG